MEFHVPAPRQGLLAEWFVEHGDEIEPGDALTRIVCEGEQAAWKLCADEACTTDKVSMLTKRIIACLDVRGGRVVKGVQFVDIVDAGDPAELAHRHAAAGADEIVLLDITATHEGRGTLLDTVKRTAAKLFVPFTVGGGVRTAEDAAAVFEAGADKVTHQLGGDCAAGVDWGDWRRALGRRR